MRREMRLLLLFVMSLWAASTLSAQETTELRFLCFSDTNECEVYDDLLSRFSQANPGIRVAIEVAEAAEIEARLSEGLSAGAAPDIARITDIGALAGNYLDLRPYMEETASFAAGFQAPFLDAMRAGDGEGLHGFPDALGVVAPFVNVSLFNEAGLPLPEDGSDWEEWLAALEQVVEATDAAYVLAVDNKDHRLVGPAMSLGARYFDDAGALALADDAGLRAFLAILDQLMKAGRTPADTLIGAGKSQEYFVRGETVMYICGSWKVAEVAAQVGDDFDWAIVANPAGSTGGTGVAQATAVVALAATDHPDAVAKVIEYLARPAIIAEFAARTLTIPARLEVAAATIDYGTDDATIAAALNAFAREVPKLQAQAVALDLHPLAGVYYEASNKYLRGYFAGEYGLDEALAGLKARLGGG